jgi:cell division protein FtsA
MEANFHIISGLVSAVKNINKCVENANLQAHELILEPLASSEAVLDNQEKDAGVVLVDIGGGTTDVAIFHEGIIRHTAVIPLGGNIVTEDIKQGCSVLRNQAELLKIKFGSALANENKDNEVICVPGLRGRDHKEISVKNLAYIIEARMIEIIEHVYYEIQASGFEGKLIGGIVITGGGAQLKHLVQLVEYVTGLECRVGFPNEHLAKNEELPKKIFDELKSPLFATGIGLLIKGIEATEYEDESNVAKQQTTKTVTDDGKMRFGFLDRLKTFISDDNVNVDDNDYIR